MSTNEYREALRRIRDRYEVWCGAHGADHAAEAALSLAEVMNEAEALLARPEPRPIRSYYEFFERVRETGWNPSPEELRAQLIAAEHSPRITREEALELLDDYCNQRQTAWGGDRMALIQSALLAAMGVDK